MNWATVLTSAAVGVLVSGLLTLLGQHLERKARRDELILTKALETAMHRTKVAVDVARNSGAGLSLADEVICAETYVRWLKHLMKTGSLPPDADKSRRED